MDKCSAASGMTDNENRLFDFYFAEFRKKYIIEKKRRDGEKRMRHKKQNHTHKEKKVPAEPEQFPADLKSLLINAHPKFLSVPIILEKLTDLNLICNQTHFEHIFIVNIKRMFFTGSRDT